jgi:hypothetical protein
VPLEYRWKLFPEAAITVVKLDWLSAITRGDVMKSKIEIFGLPIPHFTKHLHIWGEAGTVKLPKNGKVQPCGVTCVFIGYAANHEGDCYRMWNPTTGMVMLSRDVVVLQHMFFEKANSEATMQQPVVFIPGGSVVEDNIVDDGELEMITVIKKEGGVDTEDDDTTAADEAADKAEDTTDKAADKGFKVVTTCFG